VEIWELGDKKKKTLFRIDQVITEIRVIDEEKGIIAFTAIPDPRKWERKVINGEDGFFNKLDNIFLSIDELKKALPQLAGKPIYMEKLVLHDKEKYLRRSKKRIEGTRSDD